MRTIITILIISTFFACKTVNSLSQEETVANITEKVESTKYTFVPTTALPMSSQSIQLSDSYFLKISKDTIESYLPYFGRAYTAPISSTEGGIKFICTEFDYTISPKSKDKWDIKIETKNTPQKYILTLNIGDTGYTTLTVQENSRQSISFYGKVE